MVILFLFVVAVTSWVAGSRLIAPAHRDVGDPPSELPAASCRLESDSGATLAGWHIPNPNASVTVILLHPIRGDRRSMLGRAKLFHAEGYAVLMIDLQAHGESSGDAITVGYREKKDVRAAVEFVRQLSPEHQIAIVGRSLGGAAALLGSPIAVDAMVLESVYPTIDQAVSNRIGMRLGPLKHPLLPLLLWQLKPRLGISSDDLRPIDYCDDISCPVMFLIGEQDQHTTTEETKRMFERASEPKELVVFKGAAHEDLLQHDRKLYQSKVVSFLDRHLQSTAADIAPR